MMPRKRFPRQAEEEEEYDFDEEFEEEEEEVILTDEELTLASCLLQAVELGDQEKTRTILGEAGQKGYDKASIINATIDLGTTVMTSSFAHEDVQISKILLEEGGDPFISPYEGESAFLIACHLGSIPLIDLLINSNILPIFGPIHSRNGVTEDCALHVAAASGNVNIVRYLLDKGSFVNVSKPSNKYTALHIAIENGFIDVVQELLKSGAQVNTTDIEGLTPLLFAASLEDEEVGIEIAKLLIEKKADINKCDLNGSTAFDIADSERHWKFAMFIREQGCKRSVIHANEIGFEPIHFEQYYSKNGPGYITRLSNVLINSDLYVAGGCKSVTLNEIESKIETEGDYDLEGLIPFRETTQMHHVDLKEIKKTPLVNLEELKFPKDLSLDLSSQGKGLTIEGLEVTFRLDSRNSKVENLQEFQDVNEDENKDEEDIDNDGDSVSSILADRYLTKEISGPIAYYEIKVSDSKHRSITPIFAVGFVITDSWVPDSHIGWVSGSLGFHSDDGRPRYVPDDEDEEMNWIGTNWGYGDIVGAGYIFDTKEYFFTLNGKFLGIYTNCDELGSDRVRPALSFATSDTKVSFNFGSSPFIFNFYVPTLDFDLVQNFDFDILTILKSNRSNEDELLVLPNSASFFVYFNVKTKSLETINCSGNIKLPIHAEHSCNLVNNKVVISFSNESCFEDSRKCPFLYVLDLNKKSWVNIMAKSNLAQKQLVKTFEKQTIDTILTYDEQRKTQTISVISQDKLHNLNLDTLKLVSKKILGFAPYEDFSSLVLEKNLALIFSLGPNATYKYSILDLDQLKYFTPLASGFIYPSVGKSEFYFDKKIYGIGGFTSEASTVPHIQVGITNPDYSNGLLNSLLESSNVSKYGETFEINFSSQKDSEKVILAHKSVLYARSSFFRDFFKNQDSNKITLEWSYKFIYPLIKYFYSDMIDQTLIKSTEFDLMVPVVQKISPEHLQRITQHIIFTSTDYTNSTFNSDFSDLLKNSNFYDITINTSDGCQIRAHKPLLRSFDYQLLSTLNHTTCLALLQSLYSNKFIHLENITSIEQIDLLDRLAKSWNYIDLENSARIARLISQ